MTIFIKMTSLQINSMVHLLNLFLNIHFFLEKNDQTTHKSGKGIGWLFFQMHVVSINGLILNWKQVETKVSRLKTEEKVFCGSGLCSIRRFMRWCWPGFQGSSPAISERNEGKLTFDWWFKNRNSACFFKKERKCMLVFYSPDDRCILCLFDHLGNRQWDRCFRN